MLNSWSSESSLKDQGCSQHPEKAALDMAPWHYAHTTLCPTTPSCITRFLSTHIGVDAGLGPRAPFTPLSRVLSLQPLLRLFLPHRPFSNVIRTMSGTQAGVLSAKPLLMLLAKTNGSFLCSENTIILPCFHIYFVLLDYSY